MGNVVLGADRGRERRSPGVSAVMMLLLPALWLATPTPSPAQEPPRLAELSWLAGQWMAESAEQRLEEWWSAPVQNSMVGHFRWIRGEQLWITELLSITEEEGEVLFRLRHFSASMHAWEEQDDPFVYRMSDHGEGRVEFTIAEPRPGRPIRFIYQALPGDSLLVRIEGEEDGRPTTQDFRYARVGGDAGGSREPVVARSSAVDGARPLLLELMEQESAPGWAVAVVRDGRLVWSEGFGSADIASDRPVRRDTRFRTGSVSKVLTGAALLRLQDSGVVELDDDVRSLVPEVSWQPVPITLLQLAGHLGGIRHYGQGEYFNTRRYQRVPDAIGIFSADSLRSTPGTDYHYSSYGYNLLGAALAAAADAPYEQVVRMAVLEPLGLAHTAPEADVAAAEMATPHMVDEDNFVAEPHFDPSDRVPSGGWVASAEDVARLGAALLDSAFLSTESRTLMFRSQRTEGGEETGYSVGLRITTDSAGRAIAHHGGTSVGARAFLLVYPENGLSLAVLANGPAGFDETDLEQVAAAFLANP